MKKLFITLLSLFVFQHLSAQFNVWDGPKEVLKNQGSVYHGDARSFDEFTFRFDQGLESYNDTTIEICRFNFSQNTNNWVDNYKIIHTFDTQGRIVESVSQNFIGQWGNVAKSESNFDSQGNISSSISSTWNPVNSSFIPSSKDSFVYDQNNHLIEHFSFRNGSMGLEFERKWEYRIDNSGNTIEEVRSSWNAANNAWILQGKKEFIFNSNGQNTETIEFWWESNLMAWEEKFRYTQSFTASGKPQEQIIFDTGNGLGGVFRQSFIYDSNDLLVNFNYYGGFSSNWVLEIEEFYTYDTAKRLTERVEMGYVTNPSRKLEFSYNAAGELEETLGYSYDNANLTFFLSQRNTLLYDANRHLLQEIEERRDTAAGSWNPDRKSEICDLTLSAEGDLLSQIQLFPNPTTRKITLKNLVPNSSISMLNSLGQVLSKQQVLQGYVEIDLSTYGSQGLYFIQAKTDRQRKVFRVIYH